MRGRIIAQPLLQLGERMRARQVEPQRRESEVDDMPVRVDQPGQQRPPLAVDLMLRPAAAIVVGIDDLQTLPSSPIEQAGEMLQLAVGADLDAVDVVDQGVGGGGGSEESGGGERQGGADHDRRIALFVPR